ncbi:hypothetical protein [Persicobacter psychrovividus]|uniref:Uncharacterized protein n=1 Tax=Persicobacter psychrovividus TaxID=387638 RepID=A0ABM7VM37_9BACT|nr:hypothetical protein PEPS_43490 [Persicobacter psychrovividus]
MPQSLPSFLISSNTWQASVRVVLNSLYQLNIYEWTFLLMGIVHYLLVEWIFDTYSSEVVINEQIQSYWLEYFYHSIRFNNCSTSIK